MLKLKSLIILIIILLFMPDCCISLAGLEVPMFSLVLLVFLGTYIVLKPTRFIKTFVFLYRNTPFKYFIWFLITTLVSGIFLVLKGSYPLVRASHIITSLVLFAGAIYMFFGLVIPKYYSINRIIKLYTVILFFILVYGIVDVVGQTLDLDVIKMIHNGIFSSRIMIWGASLTKSSVVSYNLHRAISVFFEPAYFAKFIFLSFPIIYYLSSSKKPIFKNPRVNARIKNSLPILAWINIILTISPIFILASIALTVVIYRKFFISLHKKNAVVINITFYVLMISAFFLYHSNSNILIVDIVRGVVDRVLGVLQSLGNYAAFVEVEESLATRVTMYIHSVILFFKHPLIGVGYDNSLNYMYESLAYNNFIPTPKELIYKVKMGRPLGAVSIFYRLLCETGIVGVGTFYLFLSKSISFVYNMQSSFSNIERDFLKGLHICLVITLLHTFYESSVVNPYIWFFFGISLSYYIAFRKKLQAANH